MENEHNILDWESPESDQYFITEYDSLISFFLVIVSFFLIWDAYEDYKILLNPFDGISRLVLPRWDETIFQFILGITLGISGLGIYLKNQIANHILIITHTFVITYTILEIINELQYSINISEALITAFAIMIYHFILIILIYIILKSKNIFLYKKQFNLYLLILGIVLGICPHSFDYFLIN